MACDKKQNKKTAVDNQWAKAASVGKSSDYQDKTEFSNEWVSTNKAVPSENATLAEEKFNKK